MGTLSSRIKEDKNCVGNLEIFPKKSVRDFIAEATEWAKTVLSLLHKVSLLSHNWIPFRIPVFNERRRRESEGKNPMCD